jgi:hypothetical protein
VRGVFVLDSFAAARAETHMSNVPARAVWPPPTTRRMSPRGAFKKRGIYWAKTRMYRCNENMHLVTQYNKREEARTLQTSFHDYRTEAIRLLYLREE